MFRKSLIPFLIALALGVGAAAFARNWMQNRIAAMEAERQAGVPVVVAAREIAFGEKITVESLKLVTWPPDAVPEDAFKDTAEVVGKVASQRIYPGEPVLQRRASLNAGGSSLAAMIEPTKRAVTVRVNDVIGVAGFLLPGNRVDVLATVMSDRNAKTKTLLQDIKVLAVDQTAQAEKDKPVVVRAVTLEVEPKQAEDLVAATEEGTVQLALRNPDDTLVIAEAPPPEKPKPRRAARTEPAGPPPVTVIRQTQVGESPRD